MDRDRPSDHVQELWAGGTEAVPRARQLVGDQLRDWGLSDVVDPLKLTAGELVTNAVQHGQGPIQLTMALLGDRVRLEVCDHGGGHPAIRPVQLSGPAIGGWGLRLVDQLVDSWGTHNTSGQTVVWIEKALPPQTP
jgi:anti-sigma regulatory factor (Ser/Thr protein kinase)